MNRDDNLTAAVLLRRTFGGLKVAFSAREMFLPEAICAKMVVFDKGDRLRKHALIHRRILMITRGSSRPWVICLGQNNHRQLGTGFVASLMALGYFNPGYDMEEQVSDRILACTGSDHLLVCARRDGVLVVPDNSIHLDQVMSRIEPVTRGHIAQHGQRVVDIPEQLYQEPGQQVMLYRPSLVPRLTAALHQVLQTPPEI